MNTILILFFYFVVVVLPVIFWFWFFRVLDKKDPEPKPFLVKIFKFGIIALVLAFFAEVFLDGFLGVDPAMEEVSQTGNIITKSGFLVLISFFLAGPIEELMKYLMLKRAVFKSGHFNQIADGVVYGVALALGFAFIENTGYFIDLYSSLPKEEFIIIAVIRGVSTTLLHVVVTGILGLYIGYQKFNSDKKFSALKGLFIASVLHGLYNSIIFLTIGLWLNFLLVTFSFGFLVYRFRKDEVLKIQFSDSADIFGTEKKEIKKVAKITKKGGVGVMPTDTVYGVVCSALDKKAIEKMYRVCKRDEHKPFVIIIRKVEDLKLFGIKLTRELGDVIEKVWPGKISVVLPCHDHNLEYLHKGQFSVAFRLTDESSLIDLIDRAGPLASTSANPQGEKPAENIMEARSYFGKEVDFFVDGGQKPSISSTIIKVSGGNIEILRQGAGNVSFLFSDERKKDV